MSDLGATIVKILTADPAVNALVGSRIFSDMLPQSQEIPAVVFWTVTSTANQPIDDPHYDFDGFDVQFDSIGRTRSESGQLHKAVRLAILNAGRTTVDAVPLREVSRSGGQRETVIRPSSGDDQYRYITTQDYTFFFCSMT